jgi:hypothetical protein
MPCLLCAQMQLRQVLQQQRAAPGGRTAGCGRC